jgi:hypothetical protein
MTDAADAVLIHTLSGPKIGPMYVNAKRHETWDRWLIRVGEATLDSTARCIGDDDPIKRGSDTLVGEEQRRVGPRRQPHNQRAVHAMRTPG